MAIAINTPLAAPILTKRDMYACAPSRMAAWWRAGGLVGRSYQGVGVPHAVGGADQSNDTVLSITTPCCCKGGLPFETRWTTLCIELAVV